MKSACNRTDPINMPSVQLHAEREREKMYHTVPR
jgi:hypothetical protein